MSPFLWVVRAFRAAVRSEVERAMSDRRRALQSSLTPVSDAEAERIRRFLAGQGVIVTGPAEIIPFPANDQNTPPPSAA